MKAIRFTAVAIAMIAAISGCTTRVADMTIASSKNINLNSGQFSEGRRVSGSDSVAVVLFPLGYPNVKEAIDKAVEKDQCAVGLSDVVIYSEFFAFIFGYQQFNVEGNLIIDHGKPGCGGYAQTSSQQRYAPTQTSAQQSYAPSKEQQIQQLQQRNLPYEQYQQEYRRIMGN